MKNVAVTVGFTKKHLNITGIVDRNMTFDLLKNIFKKSSPEDVY